MVKEYQSLDIRPYELMHIVAYLGAGRGDEMGDERLATIWTRIRESPSLPLTLRCNVTSAYAYQNPGFALDTLDGVLFNVRRDLRILQRLGLAPGDTRPAIELFRRLYENVSSGRDLLWFDEVTSPAWAGEPELRGLYERGHALGIEAIWPARDPAECAVAKEASVDEIYAAEVLRIRPHHLMCMSCFYGGREELAPIEEDNLFEAIDVIQQRPETPIELVCGPCMICPPCHAYHLASGLCIGDVGMALRDELKDLDVLQRLGLEYGATLPAGGLIALLYERIPSTRLVCAHQDGVYRGREWRICGGPDGDPRYTRAREENLGIEDHGS
jgi:hypothetical protein